jgi:glutathione S-transferase
MKLYMSPGACSLAPHIVAREANLPIELVRVDLRAKRTASGGDYRAINPKGSVPALGLDDGTLLTEAGVLLQYLADQRPGARLIPSAGTMDRYRLQEWLSYISSDVHKVFSPLFSPATPDAVKASTKETLGVRFTYLSQRLDGQSYLMGDYTVADAYLFTVLRWTSLMGIDLTPWPLLKGYIERVAERPAVKAALAAEAAL